MAQEFRAFAAELVWSFLKERFCQVLVARLVALPPSLPCRYASALAENKTAPAGRDLECSYRPDVYVFLSPD